MSYENKLKETALDNLFEAILALKSLGDCYAFFEDLCTVSELKSMAQRWEVAKMLEDNFTYGEIAAQTGASTATISRVKRCLNYGADGYRIILERLKQAND